MSAPVPEPVEGTERKTAHGRDLPLILIAVFVAGVAGTAARLAIDLVLPVEPSGIPVSTLVINTVGSFALGVVVATVPRRAPEWLRAGITNGLLGSFTTFSALTVAAVALPGAGNPSPAVVMLALSVIAGAAAALAGIILGGLLVRRRA